MFKKIGLLNIIKISHLLTANINGIKSFIILLYSRHYIGYIGAREMSELIVFTFGIKLKYALEFVSTQFYSSQFDQ